jgi:oligopeptide/dipeptide ABC transporter ATP-binding protein
VKFLNDNKKVLDVKKLNVSFDTFDGIVNVVNNIDFHINKGETLGVVGESGCGKSLTALSIMRLVQSPPGIIEGEINFNGQNLLELPVNKMRKIRGNKISMIFQEPMTSLNPVISIGEQLEEVFYIHQRVSRSEARKKAIKALEMVHIAMPEQRVNEYPHQLSGGMRQRVMIAMALSCRPELLIADEPTTALDVTIQAQILDLMKELKEELGTAIMLITHDLGVVAEICSRAIIMYCGQIVEEAPVSLLFSKPLHPYTEGLLRSLPSIGVREKLYVIPGSVPGAKDFPKGCVFHPRCQYANDKCRNEVPPMTDVGNGHRVKCWLRCDGGMEV